ncbi:MAG: hypothetical protein KG028_07980 [Actinobacteria bacterium]|jgi:hypothetical protein|nr:hypothetical protein [Actinomycetota bacterium]
MPSVVADARVYLGRSLDEVLDVLGPDAEPIPGDEYGRLDDVTSIEYTPVYPGTLYLQDGVVDLVYLGRGALADVTRSQITAEVGDDGVRLRSRAGKQANLVVHAEQGVAYSAEGDTLHFLEVFRPRSQAAYEAEIYADPGAFIR